MFPLMPDQARDHRVASTLEVNDALELRVAQMRHEAGLDHQRHSGWAVSPEFDLLAAFERKPMITQITDHSTEGVWTHTDLSLVQVQVAHGNLTVRAFALSAERASELVERLREHVPVYRPEDPDVIPVTFWSYSKHGAMSRRRDLDADSWETIAENYPQQTRDRLERLMDGSFEPGKGGQLVLWHGEPGTGKTTALRSIAREWREWADLHYIVDPDQFFGSHADYMLDVMMNDTDITPREVGAEPEVPRWTVLILEDCGELLAPDARQEVGQALSRLLNACDGMIGRGLRVLLMLTTNEPIEKLHEAVARPGRCAARVEFQTFYPIAANEWLAAHGSDRAVGGSGNKTLADLFGIVEGFDTTAQEKVMGFAR